MIRLLSIFWSGGLIRLFLAIIPFIRLSPNAFAQDTGSVAGVVVSTWDGSPLNGVAITVRGLTIAAKSDASGRFELKNVPAGDQVLRFSKSAYASAVVTDVRVIPGETTTVNGNLRPEFYEMEEYEITAEVFVEQTEKILLERQQSLSMVEALGSDFLSRVGAGNAAESISKISGATIVDGKSAVIRGLNDRYVTTTLNGASVPSADPYRQSASLDLFPAQVIDRVVVAKTFTPDQPGTYTGGGIDLVTKSFPEKPFVSLSFGLAYNTQSTFKDEFLSYKGGAFDWAAIDDGTRALPGKISEEAPLGQRYPDAPFSSGPINTPLFTQSVSNATKIDTLSRELGTTEFAPQRETAPFNHNFSFAAGGSTNALGGHLGYFGGLNYKHDYSLYENGVSSRYQSGTELQNSYRDTRALSIVNWSSMVNLAYRPFENHELGFTFFYNQNAVDDSRIQDQGVEANSSGGTYRKFYMHWTERNLNTYQIKGTHTIPQAKNLQFDWLVALTQTTQDEPDARFFNDVNNGSGYTTEGNSIPAPSKPTRYFRNLEENNRNVKLDWTLPFQNWTEEEARLKWGYFGSPSARTFGERQFYYPGHSGYNNDPNQYLTEDRLGLISVRTNVVNGKPRSLTFNWGDYFQVFDSQYNGDRNVQAGYLMTDLPIAPKLRLVGGARYETTDFNVHSESYLDSSVTSLKTNDTELARSDLLPSMGLVYNVVSNMNVRLNYSQTIARPSYRELAAYYSYDPVISDFVEGNPLLRMTDIDNYDVRWEWFRRPGELWCVSFFYKDLKDAIERGNLKQEGNVITYLNNDAQLYGFELEARKSLDFLGTELSPFSIGGNFSWIASEVKLAPNDLATKRQFFPEISDTRPLYDQSPYIFNFDLNYDNRRSGTTVSLILNIAGPRIAITKLNTEDVYEQPAPTLDFVAGQKIGAHTTVKFFAKNLLDPTIERTYGKKSDLVYSSYTRGRTFGLSMNYDF